MDDLNAKQKAALKNARKTSKSRERSNEKALKKQTEELVKRHRPRGEPVIGANAQLQDLRVWIEEQMHEEKLDDADCAISEQSSGDKVKENVSSNNRAAKSPQS